MHRIIVICIFFILSIFVFQNSNISIADTKTDDFFAGRMPNGVPLEKWAMKWWQWDMTLHNYTKETDPTTGKDKCILGTNPDGRMVFLFSPYNIKGYNTQCEISSKSYILVPILTGECDSSMDTLTGNGSNIQELRKCAMLSDEPLEAWGITLDGKPLFKKDGGEEVNLHLLNETLVRNSPLFTLNIPTQNPFDAPAGSYAAVVDGYYFILKPLPPGMHTLNYHFRQGINAAGNIPSPVIGEATYAFTVK
jgi:hypothetical protein